MNARSLRPRVRFAGILAAAMLLGIAPLVQAAPGDLDPLFGSGGKVTTDFAGSLEGRTKHNALGQGGGKRHIT